MSLLADFVPLHENEEIYGVESKTFINIFFSLVWSYLLRT